MFSLVGTLLSTVTGGVIDHFKQKQELKKAINQNKIRLAQNAQSHNQDWEMKQLENAGYKDDVLFYAVIGLFAWSAIDPEASKTVFENWSYLPEWFLSLVGIVFGSVLGVKKLGDYLPSAIKGVREVLKSR